MTAIQAVNEAFGDIALVRSTPGALAGVTMPASSKEFLLAGGLPSGRVFGFDFAPVRTLPTVRQFTSERGYGSIDEDAGAARCIGDSWGILMVLDTRVWDVRWIDAHGEHDGIFVNTNVESLGTSLAAYASLAPLRKQWTPAQFAAEFKKVLLRIDAPCTEGWWSTVVEEIGFGLS